MIKIGGLVACAGFVLAIAACSETTDSAPPSAPINAESSYVDAAERVIYDDLPDGEFVLSNENATLVAGLASFDTCSVENIVRDFDESSARFTSNTYQIRRESHHIYGFVTNRAQSLVPKKAALLLLGLRTYKLRLQSGLHRGDVATYFDDSSLSSAGFSVRADFKDIHPGEYSIYILDLDDESRGVCPTHQFISVEER